MVGSDTSGYEVSPAPNSPGTGIPVHRYLLVDQGVHLGEFHNLEGAGPAKATPSATSPRSPRSRGPPPASPSDRSRCGRQSQSTPTSL